MNADKRRQIFERLAQANPSPTTELNYSTPFELLVAVILSAQATDIGVNRATAKLFATANTPQAILELGEDRLRGYLATLNFFNTKARNLLKTCRALIDLHGGAVPRDRAALEKLVKQCRVSLGDRHVCHGINERVACELTIPSESVLVVPHLPQEAPDLFGGPVLI